MPGAFEFYINMDDVIEATEILNGAADQIPFALSQTLNHAADVTRKALIADTWPSHVKVRNTQFIKYALRYDEATKTKMSVTIYDSLNKSVKLKLHAEGGVRTARGRFAIPNEQYIQKGAHGIKPEDEPRALLNSVIIGNGIFQRVGKALQLMYVLAPTVKVPKDVPFYEDFAKNMTKAIDSYFPKAMAKAMKTRKTSGGGNGGGGGSQGG